MKIRQKLSLDFGRDTHPITVFAKQNDTNTRFIEITPLNCGQAYALEDGITPRLQLTKADGYTVLNDATIKDGVIIAELTQQALAAAGVAVAEIGLYKGEELLSSQIFHIDVKQAAFDTNAPVSSDEFNSLVDALNEIDGATEKIELAAQEAEKAVINANNAIKVTTEATETAIAAAEKAENVNISAVQTATGATVTVTDKNGVETAVHIDTLTAVNTWEDIKNAVRLGLGAELFPVGYEFTTENTITGEVITWVVRGHDHHPAANSKLKHTMTLEAKYVHSRESGTYHSFCFDAQEALYYATEELPADTYNFTLPAEYDITHGGGKTLSFTLTQPVPAGGLIMFRWGKDTQSTDVKIQTYSSSVATSSIESVAVTESADGTSLGTADGTTENLNYIERTRYGSNNYAQSAVRQWLNSDKEKSEYWVATNIFDKQPNFAFATNGFMYGLPDDFLAVVQPATISCYTNSVFEKNSLDGTEFDINQVYELQDKFFLLSSSDVYGSNDIEDGERLEYYKGFYDIEVIKYDAAGTARDCLLRSCHTKSSCGVMYVYKANGTCSPSSAYSSYGVAPACIIA